MKKSLALSFVPLVFFTAMLAGCISSTTITVTDLDADSRPIANVPVDRYALPHRYNDPWSTTPAETRTTGADGTVRFGATSGRYVVRAPGKAPAAFTSTFAPQAIAIGVSGSVQH